jgi:hypothetical protein
MPAPLRQCKSNYSPLRIRRPALRHESRIGAHCRRNPIDTCLSNYFTYFGQQQEYACSRSDLVFYYRQYCQLMAHWQKILPQEKLLEVDYEELIADRERVSRQLIIFSGLEWDDSCLNPKANNRVVKTASAWQVRQPVYNNSVDRWRRYEPWLGELRQLLPDCGSP